MTASPRTFPGIMDWSIGQYERTASQLLPAARVVVDRAAPARNEHVVDVGCGTGNAALLAAARGAWVTGIDPAPRLLAVARAEAAARELDAVFAEGHAAALALPDAGADVVLSVFGVIFAPDALAAAAEIARVTTQGGRIVLSAWIPDGAMSAIARVARESVARALGGSEGPPPFAWHDRDALAELFLPHDFVITIEEARIAFTSESPRDYLDDQFSSHPQSLAGRAVLQPRGELDTLYQELLSILEAANEDPSAFRVTSRYIVATAR